MNDLMIHVERIVRPVRAMQFRKLRMRRELLSHLQSAFDEERAAGVDDPTALAAARQRLGDPLELTKSLQASVPWIERTLMMRVRGVSALDQIERVSVPIWGADRRMTMLHSGLILLPGTILGYLALLLAVLALSPKQMLTAMVQRPRAGAMMTVLVTACTGLVIVTTQFMFAITRNQRPRGHFLRALLILVMPAVVMTIVVVAAAQRAPYAIEFLRGGIIGVALLLSILSLAQVVARLRRRYDPWLTLDIAE
jgi:hypothetical protein